MKQYLYQHSKTGLFFLDTSMFFHKYHKDYVFIENIEDVMDQRNQFIALEDLSVLARWYGDARIRES